MWNRRRVLGALAGGGIAGLAAAGRAKAASDVLLAPLRGSLDASENGLAPGSTDNQADALARLLEAAAETDTPVFLPGGTYVVSGIRLPRRVRLAGVSGATRIIHGADGHLFLAEDAEHISFSGIIFDGASRPAGGAMGLLELRRVDALDIDDCAVTGSGGNGIALEACRGRVVRTGIANAREAGLYSVAARGMEISGNTVTDCANGGILVHRWEPGEDGTLVTGNRVERIAAANGGTGQFGNGINLYRAGGVIVANNRVADCAFSAIRANSAGNAQIIGNSCLRSGETAIYSEFAFEGAVISSNIVDGAANGISIVNFNEGGRLAVCAGNVVRNLSTEGPYPADPPGFGVGITVEADTAVTGNVVENAPLYGMHLGWGPFLRNVVASGNVIRKAGEGIAVSVVDGAGPAVITDNVISETARGAVVGHRWSEAVTGDLAIEGASAFPQLMVERNHTG